MAFSETLFRNSSRMAMGRGGATSGNVGESERFVSLLAGSAITAYGLGRRTPAGRLLAALGGALLYRGATGRCPAYSALGIETVHNEHNPGASVPYGRGLRVEKAIFIDCSPEEVYSFWRELPNLPRFLSHVESVSVIDGKTSHWVARAPAGRTVEWDAEIINDAPNELLAWRSLPGAGVANAGSVRFQGSGGSTRVQVEMEYLPPAGVMGSMIAKLFGEEPGQQVQDDLERLKKILEARRGGA